MQEQLNAFLKQADEETLAIINALTNNNPAALLSLKKEEPKKEKKPRRQKSTADPYPIGIITRCTLCNSHRYETFYMADGIKGTGVDCLVATCPIPSPTGFRLSPDVWIQRKTGRCPNCKSYLKTLSQDSLISIILGEKVNR